MSFYPLQHFMLFLRDVCVLFSTIQAKAADWVFVVKSRCKLPCILFRK